jgi:hypothetical protein
MASHSRWTWLPYRRKLERSDREGIDRRTVLVGAAATAGVVAANATPSMAAPASTAKTAAVALPATNLAVAQTPPGTIPASQVTYVPTGEILDTDVQSVLSTMDQRLSKMRLIDDLQVAMTLVDDFMGATSASGTIGQLGWALPAGSTGTAAVAAAASEPGIFVLGTGTTPSGWSGINLGANNLIGAPVLMCEWRLKLTQLNNASDKYSLWFGLHNAISGSEPTTGMYFRYTSADTQWFAACADAGTPNAVATNVAADTDFHRYRMTADGAGVARFYIDDAQVAVVVSSLPSTNSYTPNLIIRKNVGTVARTVRVDYFALRYEHAR